MQLPIGKQIKAARSDKGRKVYSPMTNSRAIPTELRAAATARVRTLIAVTGASRWSAIVEAATDFGLHPNTVRIWCNGGDFSASGRNANS